MNQVSYIINDYGHSYTVIPTQTSCHFKVGKYSGILSLAEIQRDTGCVTISEFMIFLKQCSEHHHQDGWNYGAEGSYTSEKTYCLHFYRKHHTNAVIGCGITLRKINKYDTLFAEHTELQKKYAELRTEITELQERYIVC